MTMELWRDSVIWNAGCRHKEQVYCCCLSLWSTHRPPHINEVEIWEENQTGSERDVPDRSNLNNGGPNFKMFVQHRGRATHEERKHGADLNYLISLLMMLSFLPEVCSFHISMPHMHRVHKLENSFAEAVITLMASFVSCSTTTHDPVEVVSHPPYTPKSVSNQWIFERIYNHQTRDTLSLYIDAGSQPTHISTLALYRFCDISNIK